MLWTWFWAAFLLLISISLTANLLRISTKSVNIFLHALSFVPAACALAALAFWLSLGAVFLLIGLLSLALGEKIAAILVVLAFIALPILFFIGIIKIFRYFADKNPRKHIFAAYIFVFAASGFLGISTYPLLLINEDYGFIKTKILWNQVDIDNSFSLESQRLPLIFDEYLLRICFKSGKLVDIYPDLGGSCEFDIYKLKNDCFFMDRYREGFYDSYIVDPKLEQVFVIEKDVIYELEGSDVLEEEYRKKQALALGDILDSKIPFGYLCPEFFQEGKEFLSKAKFESRFSQ